MKAASMSLILPRNVDRDYLIKQCIQSGAYGLPKVTNTAFSGSNLIQRNIILTKGKKPLYQNITVHVVNPALVLNSFKECASTRCCCRLFHAFTTQ